jgi:hypothetical protein
MIATVSNNARSGSMISRLPATLLGVPLRRAILAPFRRRTDRIANQYRTARLTLGKRMYEAGIDDGETGAQIAALEQEIHAVRYAGRLPEDLEERRESLLIRLADAALEDDAPLPGADAEFAEAWALKTAHAAV